MFIFIVGIVGGTMAGLLGIGAGTIFIPGLTLLTSLSQHAAQGTALGAMIPIAVLGFLKYHSRQKVAMTQGVYVILGSLAGVIIGATAAVSLPAVVLQAAFSFFMFIIGVRLIVSR